MTSKQTKTPTVGAERGFQVALVDGNQQCNCSPDASSRTSPSLATLACHCGPGGNSPARYTCLTCGKFARIGRRIAERAPYLHTERRAV